MNGRAATKILLVLALAMPLVAMGGQAASATALPNTNIVKDTATGHFIFKPTTVKTHWSAAGDCTSANEVGSISNKTSKPQTIMYKTETLTTIAPKSQALLCFWGSGKATFRLRIKGQSENTVAFKVS